MRAIRFASLVLGTVGLASAALAQPPASPAAAQSKPRRADACFRSNDFQPWRPINDHAFYMRANINDIYRIDLSSSCPELTYPDVRLDTVVRGTNMICGPLDWDLRVAQNGPGGISVSCIVSAQTRLSKQEAAAIPPKLRP